MEITRLVKQILCIQCLGWGLGVAGVGGGGVAKECRSVGSGPACAGNIYLWSHLYFLFFAVRSKSV